MKLKPVTPMDKPEGFEEFSSLGKIPAYQDDELSVSDSSVICAYLDAKHGKNSIYPLDLIQRTKALWFEEYADSKLAELCGGVFFERVVKPNFLQQETDKNRVNSIISNELPIAMD